MNSDREKSRIIKFRTPPKQSAPIAGITDWWSVPRFEGVDDGMADRLDRIKATGNGQVPGVAALAWSVLTSDF